MRRYADKRDENERGIIEYLKRIGCLVEQVSMRKVPDLLVGILNSPYVVLIEIKMPSGKLTTSQEIFFEEWEGKFVFVAHSINEIKKIVRLFMPVRIYKCENCGTIEKVEKFSSEPLTKCPTCGKIIVQQYSVPQIIYKGTGWAGKDGH